MTIGMLETELPFAEIDLAGDAGVHHPLERAVDGRAADPLILAPDEIDEIVGGEVTFLAKKDVDDQVALARPLAACWPKAIEVAQTPIARPDHPRQVRRVRR